MINRAENVYEEVFSGTAEKSANTIKTGVW